MNTISQHNGPFSRLRSWGRQLLDRIRNLGSSKGQLHEYAMAERTRDGHVTTITHPGSGVIGDQVEFVGGPLDGFTHTLHDSQEIPYRLALPISNEMFQALDEYPCDWNPNWPLATKRISSIAFYVLRSTDCSWRYQYWGSGSV